MDYEEEDKEEFVADTPETDDLEPEEAILARQVELVTPATAKEAAAKIIRAKKQVTFLEQTAITKE
jgi:hypothetical protein